MVTALILAAGLLAQTPAPPQVLRAAQDPAPSELSEVVVETQRRREAAQAFVEAVAEPIRGRKAAVWRDSVCVGVGGMQAEPARYMADRISDWAASVGLSIEAPGCTPDIFVVATNNGDATARELVQSRPREFRTGAGDSDRGARALEVFQTSGRPIRWWHVSLPINADTGHRWSAFPDSSHSPPTPSPSRPTLGHRASSPRRPF